MGEHKVPTGPGWWWVEPAGVEAYPVMVDAMPDGRLVCGEREAPVLPSGCWLAPVLTPSEADALRHDLAYADAENDDAWDALGGMNVPTLEAGVRALTALVDALTTRAEAAEGDAARFERDLTALHGDYDANDTALRAALRGVASQAGRIAVSKGIAGTRAEGLFHDVRDLANLAAKGSTP